MQNLILKLETKFKDLVNRPKIYDLIATSGPHIFGEKSIFSRNNFYKEIKWIEYSTNLYLPSPVFKTLTEKKDSYFLSDFLDAKLFCGKQTISPLLLLPDSEEKPLIFRCKYVVPIQDIVLHEDSYGETQITGITLPLDNLYTELDNIGRVRACLPYDIEILNSN